MSVSIKGVADVLSGNRSAWDELYANFNPVVAAVLICEEGLVLASYSAHRYSIPQEELGLGETIYTALYRMLAVNFGLDLQPHKLESLERIENLVILGVYEGTIGSNNKIELVVNVGIRLPSSVKLRGVGGWLTVQNEFELWNHCHGIAPVKLVGTFDAVIQAFSRRLITWSCDRVRLQFVPRDRTRRIIIGSPLVVASS